MNYSIFSNFSGVYFIINKINNKFYIGSTKNFKKRFYDHIGRLNRNEHHSKHLQLAWNKYGEDNFEFIEIVCVPNIGHLLFVEQYFLDEYKTYDRINGYNNGKNASRPLQGKKLSNKHQEALIRANKGRECSKETRLKISKANTGRVRSQETKIKLSNAAKGRIVSELTRKAIKEKMIGRTFSDETRKKMSDIQFKLQSKPFLCIETKEIFNNSREAYEKLGINDGQYVYITLSLSHYTKSAFGYHFIYLNELPAYIIERNYIITDNDIGILYKLCGERPFILIGCDNIFLRIKDAAKYTGLNEVTVSKYLKGRKYIRKRKKGLENFNFKYL